jgi:hypothetical protein
MATQTVTIAVPLLLLILIAYCVKHRKTKIGAVLLGFLLGISLAPTGLANTIVDQVVSTLVSGVSAVFGVFGG